MGQTLYNYAENGEFLYSSEAFESPLEPGVYLIPRNATIIKPLKSKKGYAIVFTNGSWNYIVDNRGTEYWFSYYEGGIITELGEDIPKNSTLIRPEAPKEESITSNNSITLDFLLSEIQSLKNQINILTSVEVANN